ncbi:MBL fold metallo-hydrolase [Pseudoflavitalea rhizosphaerae]|uniref:MBL fold metallo-hydrolase n=1 Tax=Pseudoflavitalea rhizosphaerae TaxID=1884793 RepID=UPI000F8CE375|nr:MBL fold metallo-hydrolase [Pseudoflavitalea rhizosphaerae]
MNVNVLQADKGDCFILSWVHEEKQVQLMIDSGIKSTYKSIKHILRDNNTLSAIIITHVDYDHVGGLFSLLDDPSMKLSDDCHIFLNTPNLVLKKEEGEKVGIQHGIKLEKVLLEKKVKCLPMYVGIFPNDELQVKGLRLKILSPTKSILEKLSEKWTAEEIQKMYLQEQDSIDEKVSRKNRDEATSITELNSRQEQFHKVEDDLVNSSSISFIAEVDSKRWLFLGDSNPIVIEESIRLNGWNEQNKLKVDFVKISHHGCKYNTSRSLLSMLECSSFIISTNGSGPYYHPDKETIAKIIEFGARDSEGYIDIYFNYPLVVADLFPSNALHENKVRIKISNNY